MLQVLIMGLIVFSAGLMVWQMDFATKDEATRYEAPGPETPYPGVPPWITARAPAVAQTIHNVQMLFRGPQKAEAQPVVVRRGTRVQPGNRDVRYTKRPGDGR